MVDRPLNAELIKRLHRKANADRWGLTPERLASALRPSLAHAPSGGADLERYFGSLHLEDLVLAAACEDGNESAWEHFIREHRPILYRAADAIERSGAAREAADALYAELFGLTERDGQRRSLFRYFHGRSSLATWLRAVLAQRYVDALRRARRLEPLPADDEASLPAGAGGSLPDQSRFVELMRKALAVAIQQLAPRDRLRLACYYAQGLTLAQIGRTLSEHEATTSRHLARTRHAIREDVERQLKQSGMTEAEVEDCFESVITDAGTLDLAEMFPASRKNADIDRSN